MGILRRLREWREDKDGTLIGPNINADSVNTGSLAIDDVTPDYPFRVTDVTVEDSNQTTTNTSDTRVISCKGGVDPTNIPPDYTLYARFIVSFGINDSNETVFCYPRFAEPGVANYDVDELEVSSSSVYPALGDSGWVDVSGVGWSTTVFFDSIRARVSNNSAEATVDPTRVSVAFAGVVE